MCVEAQTTAHFCGMKTLHTAGDYTSREEGTKKKEGNTLQYGSLVNIS